MTEKVLSTATTAGAQRLSANALAGKVALVTGAGRGIGRAIAMGLAQAGASVVCTARSATEIAATAALITDAGGQACSITADVTDAISLEAAFAHASQRFGGIDIVFANAGMSPRGSVAEGDPSVWRRTMETNVFGVYLTARTAIPWLRRRGGGKIIVTGSGARQKAAEGRSAYGASKAAVWMFVQTLAVELQQENISVNELIPGPVRTVLTNFGEREMPAGEWIKEPKDVVPMALFLAAHPEPGPTAQSFSLMRRA